MTLMHATMETITRILPGPYMFTVDITYSAGSYHIVPTEGSGHNFLLIYFLSNTAVTDGSTVSNRTDTGAVFVNTSNSQSGLLMNTNSHFAAKGTVIVDFYTCVNNHFFCLYLHEDNSGSYTEMNATDNVYCIDFDAHKTCSPGEILT